MKYILLTLFFLCCFSHSAFAGCWSDADCDYDEICVCDTQNGNCTVQGVCTDDGRDWSFEGSLTKSLSLEAAPVASESTGLNKSRKWRGLVVAPENRCSSYDKSEQYPYPQSVEDQIVNQMGGNVYGPYTGRYFKSDRDTDIEHIVAASEGHDSGLCSASAQKRRRFATDLLNLTLAAPEINRCGPGGKCGHDAAEWLPDKNKCWFANRVVRVKRRYQLSVDINEARALESILRKCESTKMIFFPKR